MQRKRQLVLVKLVFQLDDLDINPLLPFFLGNLHTYVCVHVRMHWGGDRWLWGQLRAHKPPLISPASTLKNDP